MVGPMWQQLRDAMMNIHSRLARFLALLKLVSSLRILPSNGAPDPFTSLRTWIEIPRMAESKAWAAAIDATRRKLRLLAMPCLFVEHGRIDRYVPEGATVAGHIAALGWPSLSNLHARVTIDGHLIPDAQWEYVVPLANQSLVIRGVPMGGGAGAGGGGGKSAMRIVGMLAFGMATLYMSNGSSGGLAPTLAQYFGMVPGIVGGMMTKGSNPALAAAALLTLGGTLALQALIPPPRPRRAQLQKGTPCLPC